VGHLLSAFFLYGVSEDSQNSLEKAFSYFEGLSSEI
jgi:hypothetical protein